MTKPIVFISHSSKDERLVRKLKGALTKKVGNTLDIFVSSDGQSIQLGRNWVHEIEQALKESKIMFVLLSPNSIHSNWLYFEAGVAYSRGIKVIPIGVLGIDLSQIPPPMGLLQGFNINSVESLNNLISVLNREFDYSLEAFFNYEEYATIFGVPTVKTSETLKEYASLIYDMSAEVTPAIDRPIEAIIDYFKSSKVDYQSEENMVDTHGVSILTTGDSLVFGIDPDLLDLTIATIGETMKIVRGSGFEFYSLFIDFVPLTNCVQEKHKVTSRIYNTEFKIVDNYYLGYSDIVFKVSRRYYLKGFSPYVTTVTSQFSNEMQYEAGNVCMELKYYGKNLAEIPLHKLLSRLFELGILY